MCLYKIKLSTSIKCSHKNAPTSKPPAQKVWIKCAAEISWLQIMWPQIQKEQQQCEISDLSIWINQGDVYLVNFGAISHTVKTQTAWACFVPNVHHLQFVKEINCNSESNLSANFNQRIKYLAFKNFNFKIFYLTDSSCLCQSYISLCCTIRAQRPFKVLYIKHLTETSKSRIIGEIIRIQLF